MAKRKLSLSIEEAVIKAAKIRAIQEGTSVSAQVERMLRLWLGEDLEDGKKADE